MNTAKIKLRGNIIWIHGTIDGEFYRKSTGVKATDKNIKTYEGKNLIQVLSNLIINKKPRLLRSMSLETFGNQVLQSRKSKQSNAVHKDYKSIFKNKILPDFGNKPMENIKLMDIETWEEKFTYLSLARRSRIRNVFRMILKKASANDVIPKNPYDDIDKLVDTKPTQPESIYTSQEVRSIIDHADGWYKVYLCILFHTGVRVGEAIGLQWSDIDFENKMIHLQRTWTKGEVIYSSIKKNHNRLVPMSDELFELLRDYAENKRHDTWLFILNKSNKNPFYDNSTIKETLKEIFERAEVEYKSLRASRPSFISLMIEKKVPLSKIQKTVGHRIGSRVTVDHYFKSTDDDNIQEIALHVSRALGEEKR